MRPPRAARSRARGHRDRTRALVPGQRLRSLCDPTWLSYSPGPLDRPTENVVDDRVRIRLPRRDAVEHLLELTRRQHALLDVLHEAMRHQLADAELGARAAPLAQRPGGVLAELLDGRDELGGPLAGRRFRLHDRRTPLPVGERVELQQRLDPWGSWCGTLPICLATGG